MVKGGGGMKVEWIWRVSNMAFESCVVSENWRSVVVVSLYKSKGERTDFKNYGGLSLLREHENIYEEIAEERVSKVTGFD